MTAPADPDLSGGAPDPTAPLPDSTPLLDDLDALHARWGRDGCLWLPGLLPAVALAPLRQRVAALLVELGWRDADGRTQVDTPAYDAPGFLHLQRRTFASDEMDAIRRHPNLLRVLTRLVGGAPYPGLGDLVRIRCTGARTRPHQDQHYVQGATDRVTAWFALEPVPWDLGPVALQPGSHTGGKRHHEGPGLGEHGIVPEPRGGWHSAQVQPGDALLFSSMTVHKALATTRPSAMRVSVDFRYGPPRPGGPPPPV